MWKLLCPAITMVVSILFISACGPAATLSPTSAPTEAPAAVVPTNTPIPMLTEVPKVATPAETSVACPTPGEPTDYYQPSQVILVGPPDKIEDVVAAAREAQIGLTPLLEEPLPPRAPGELGEKIGGWTLQAYQVCDQRKVPSPNDWERVGDVVAIAYEMKVLADPNYLVASDQGQPPKVEFSPHHGGESEFGGANPVADKAVFDNQWALGKWPGVDLPGKGACSDNTTVYVFDTEPAQTHSWLTIVSTPVSLPPLVSGKATCSTSNHGLFVSGLVNKTAPKAEIKLYPVLNSCGVGTLLGIEQALWLVSLYMQEPSVLNLSLGVVRDENDEKVYFSKDTFEGVRPQACVFPWGNPNERVVKDLCALDTVLELFRQTGGVVVAAAGNDSWVDPENPKQMQLPAAYETVIGVAGSNMTGARSCFSNFGKLSNGDLWVSAPGGEGATIGGTPCAPAAGLCSTPAPDPNCPYAVVGPIDTGASGPGYAYWSGTSFAAPLVSGLAACILASCGTACSGSSATTEVFNRIECGASPKPAGTPTPSSPGRVINVPTTLSSSCP